jgi:quinol monooxygenase YgiN
MAKGAANDPARSAQAIAAGFLDKYGEDGSAYRPFKAYAIDHVANLAKIPPDNRPAFCKLLDYLIEKTRTDEGWLRANWRRDEIVNNAMRAAQIAVRKADKAIQALTHEQRRHLASVLYNEDGFRVWPRRNSDDAAAEARFKQDIFPDLLPMLVRALALITGDSPDFKYGRRRARGTKARWPLRVFVSGLGEIVSSNRGSLSCYRDSNNRLGGTIVDALEFLRPLLPELMPHVLPATIVIDAYKERGT